MLEDPPTGKDAGIPGLTYVSEVTLMLHGVIGGKMGAFQLYCSPIMGRLESWSEHFGALSVRARIRSMYSNDA